MVKNEIIIKLKEQYQDAYTVEILADYIEEFQILMGDYISADEIIKRLKENVILDFEYTEEPINGVLDGQYDIANKKVIIYKHEQSDPDYIKFVLFHELTHAITSKKLEDGKDIMGFSFIEQSYGKGFNEAMTEWLSIRRNEMLNQKHDSGYDVIVEQIKVLAQIVGEVELIKCYLNEPESLKKLLEKNNIDFDRLDRLYQIILSCRIDIYRLANGKVLDKITNYNLYKECQEINDIYSNAIGDIKTIDDFKRKYSILCSYKEPTFNINNIISNKFYLCIYNDAVALMNRGYKINEIEQNVRDSGISIAKINQAIEYNRILAKGKNEAIIELYQAGCKNEDDYRNFAYGNYSILYDKFSEDNFIPNEKCIYDVDRYFIIGEFLSQHSDYDYNEISVECLKLSNNIKTYKIKTFNGNTYIYTIPLMSVAKKNNDSFELLFNNEKINITNEGENINIRTNGKEIVKLEEGYYLESQLELFEYRMNDEQLSDGERRYYKQKFDSIMEKINIREKEKFQGE